MRLFDTLLAVNFRPSVADSISSYLAVHRYHGVIGFKVLAKMVSQMTNCKEQAEVLQQMRGTTPDINMRLKVATIPDSKCAVGT